MPYAQKDVDALKAAIATGATKVRFADNREVTYRSLVEMRSVLADIVREVGGAQAERPNRIVAGFRSNLS